VSNRLSSHTWCRIGRVHVLKKYTRLRTRISSWKTTVDFIRFWSFEKWYRSRVETLSVYAGSKKTSSSHLFFTKPIGEFDKCIARKILSTPPIRVFTARKKVKLKRNRYCKSKIFLGPPLVRMPTNTHRISINTVIWFLDNSEYFMKKRWTNERVRERERERKRERVRKNVTYARQMEETLCYYR